MDEPQGIKNKQIRYKHERNYNKDRSRNNDYRN